MSTGNGSKRRRQERPPEHQPALRPSGTSLAVLKQQRALALERLREVVAETQARNANEVDLRQRVEQLRREEKEARDSLAAMIASGDASSTFASAAKRAGELQEERELCERQLESLKPGQPVAGQREELERVVEQQGVAADLLRFLVLQVRDQGMLQEVVRVSRARALSDDAPVWHVPVRRSAYWRTACRNRSAWACGAGCLRRARPGTS